MPDPTFKEIKRGINSKIISEKIRLIVNQKELKDFCKEAGIDEISYSFIDEYHTFLFCFSGNSNEKEDLITITGTRQHSLDDADMTVHLNRELKVEGNLFQPYIVYEIGALRNPDQYTSLFLLKHHNINKEEIAKKKIKCTLARMLKYNILSNDGKTYTPELLLEDEKINSEFLIKALKPFFGKVIIENLKVSLDKNSKHDPLLLKNITQSILWSWEIPFEMEYIKTNQLTVKNKLTVKHNEKTVEFDVYQVETCWYSKSGLINIAITKDYKQKIIFITNIETIENK
jgi:hypothetical protein